MSYIESIPVRHVNKFQGPGVSPPSIIDHIKHRHLQHVPPVSAHHHSSPSLPRLSASGNSRGHLGGNIAHVQPDLVMCNEIIPSRAVAQSMVSMSSSCPDLRSSRQRNLSPDADGQLRRLKKKNCIQRSSATGGSTTGSNDSDITAPSQLVRCRVPMSVVCSPRLARRNAIGYATSHHSVGAEYQHGGTILHQSASAELKCSRGAAVTDQGSGGVGEGLACVPPTITLTPWRRPGTQEGLVSHHSSSGSMGPSTGPPTPIASRRRRNRRSPLTADNDVITQVQASLNTRTTSSCQEAQLTVAAGTGSRTLQSSVPDVFSRLHKVTQDAIPPLINNRQPQPLHTSRTQGGTLPSKAQNTPQRCNNNNMTKQNAAPKPEVVQLVASGDTTQNENYVSAEHEEDVWKGMAPETYHRCMQWVKDVESAKGSRTLDLIVLPPVQLAD